MVSDATYRRMQFSCSCGHVSRSMGAEARHRHNFPMLCKKPRIRRAKGERPPVPSLYDPATKQCDCGRVVYLATRVCPACEREFFKRKCK